MSIDEDRIREIAREEIARYAEDVVAVERARNDQGFARLAERKRELLAMTEPADDDGPVVREMKATLRGEA